MSLTILFISINSPPAFPFNKTPISTTAHLPICHHFEIRLALPISSKLSTSTSSPLFCLIVCQVFCQPLVFTAEKKADLIKTILVGLHLNPTSSPSLPSRNERGSAKKIYHHCIVIKIAVCLFVFHFCLLFVAMIHILHIFFNQHFMF